MYGGAGSYPSHYLGQSVEDPEPALSATGDADLDAAWTEYDTAIQDAYAAFEPALKAYDEALCLADETLRKRIVALAAAERTAA